MLVLLHGFGAPGTDLVSIHRQVRVPPEVRFVFPMAPLVLDPGAPPTLAPRAFWHIDILALQQAAMSGRFLELIDHQQEPTSGRQLHAQPLDQRARVFVQQRLEQVLLAEVERLADRSREVVERPRTRAHHRHSPSRRGPRRVTGLERRHNSGAQERRLPNPARALDRQPPPIATRSVAKPRRGWDGEHVYLPKQPIGEVPEDEVGPLLYQAYCPLPVFSSAKGDVHCAVSVWMVGGQPAGLSFRESRGPVTGPSARFVPHILRG